MIKQRTDDADYRVLNADHTMKGRLDRLSSQADDRVRSMAEQTSQVCAHVGAAMDSATAELRDQMTRASMRAEGRTRFKELRQLGKAWDDFKIDQDAYVDLKKNLIDLWQMQMMSARTQSPTMSNGLAGTCSPYEEPLPDIPSPRSSAKSRFAAQSPFSDGPDFN